MSLLRINKQRRFFLYSILLSMLILLSGCKHPVNNDSVDNPAVSDHTAATKSAPTPTISPSTAPQGAQSEVKEPAVSSIAEPTTTEIQPAEYSYLNDDGTNLADRINPPQGYTRVSSSSDELANFIRTFPLKAAGSEVLLYDGTPKANQSDHVAVFEMSLGDRDLQQCADSAIHMYAEYYWSIKAYDKIAFHLTNGFLMEYVKWRDGNRIKIDGNKVSWVKTAGQDDSYEEFLNYLNMVFAYAGTLSLATECDSILAEELRPGDLLLQGGSPGHCILVVDMAADSAGNPCYLLAQGYMPAQDFHVLKNPLHEEDPWYYASELSFPLTTPAWQFDEGSLVRWREFPLSGLSDEISDYSIASESIPAWSGTSVSVTEEPAQVTLLAVGDNLIHREVIASGRSKDGSLNYDHLYSNLKEEISKADLAIVNQETIFGGEKYGFSGYPRFNSPVQIGDALVNAGFDVVLHATNHTMDMGLKGVKNTMAYWKTKPEITVLGINETEDEADKVPIIVKNGIKIAMLNYTYGLNGISLPKDKPYLVNMLDKKKMKADIAYAEANADFTIVFPHWGTEYVYQATSMQKQLTKFFYEQGVDLVIGSHPHVIEPVEWIETEKGHKMLVYYSLGNFMSYQREAPRMLGAMAGITIVKDKNGTYINTADVTPIITHYENGPKDYHYAIYKLTDYTPKLAKLHGVSKIAEDGPLDYQQTLALARTVFGSWFVEKAK